MRHQLRFIIKDLLSGKSLIQNSPRLTINFLMHKKIQTKLKQCSQSDFALSTMDMGSGYEVTGHC
jgi:hypothetical protein